MRKFIQFITFVVFIVSLYEVVIQKGADIKYIYIAAGAIAIFAICAIFKPRKKRPRPLRRKYKL